MARRLTNSEFIKKLKDKDNPLIPLEPYQTSIIKIKFKCTCGIVWKAKPNNVLNGKTYRCPDCGEKSRIKNQTKSHNMFVKELNKHNILQNKELISKYVSTNKKIKIKCKICNHTWSMRPNDLLNNVGCPSCYGNKKKTHEEFLQKLKETKTEIIPLEKYINAYTPIKFQCPKCSHVWKLNPNYCYNRKVCRNCATITKGEKKVKKFLDNKNIHHTLQKTFPKCKHKALLRFDFFLPKQNMCIEYHGEHHYHFIKGYNSETALKNTKIRDGIKRTFCQTNDIQLLEIPYWNINNIENILLKEIGRVGY